MAFPTTGVLDAFTRADNTDLGANWTTTVLVGDSAISIVSNQAGYADVDSSFRDEYWNPATFGPDCEVYYTVATKPLVTTPVYLFLRLQSPGTSEVDGYYCEIVNQVATDDGGIYRLDNGVFTQLGASLSQEWSDGDGLGFEAIGSAIKAYRRSSGTWSELASRTDATYGSAGNIGIGIQGHTPRLDDFGGGTVVGGVVIPIIIANYYRRRLLNV